MKYFDVRPVVNCCDLALHLFSDDTDRVAETLFLGLYSGPGDAKSIFKEISRLDFMFWTTLEDKILRWTDDFVNIEDLRKLKLSDIEACLLAFRLENARDNIPLMLGEKDCRQTYSLGLLAADESTAVQWALTAFWSLTRESYLDRESMYLSDLMADAASS